MFYSQVILAKKGPLGKIWVAAHFDKKLTKTQIFATDINESVQAIISPSSPLALRVSGHLMLGIVRIYSRKVKYLMSDCTEAMWKIKLAFRPGNVDMTDLVGASAHNIDDPRSYGHILPDHEFPELAGAVFSQGLLARYESMGDARGRTVAHQRDTVDDDGFVDGFGGFGNDYAIDIPGLESASKASVASRSTPSRMSDIEMPRQRLRSSLDRRSGLSFASGSAPIGFNFEDDAAPPIRFDELIDGASQQNMDGFKDINPPMWQDINEEIPPFTDYPIDEPPVQMSMNESTEFDQWKEPATTNQDDHPMETNNESIEQNISVDTGLGRGARVRVDLSKEREKAREAERLRELEATQRRRNNGANSSANDNSYRNNRNEASSKRTKAKKRQKIVMDERVELPARVMKERIANPSSIVRRLPSDPLPRTSIASNSSLDAVSPLQATQRLSIPGGIGGMCSELVDLYSMTMTSDALPFPSNRPSLASGADDSTIAEVEMTREGGGNVNDRRSIGTLQSQTDVEGLDSVSSPVSFVKGKDDVTVTELEQHGDQFDHPLLGDESGFNVEFDGQTWSPAHQEDVVAQHEDALVGHGGSIRRSSVFGEAAGNRISTGAELDSDQGLDVMGRKWSTRTAAVMSIVADQLDSNDKLSFDALSSGVDKRVAATSFMEILQLKTWGFLQVHQPSPFEDITISATEKTFAVRNKVVSA